MIRAPHGRTEAWNMPRGRTVGCLGHAVRLVAETEPMSLKRQRLSALTAELDKDWEQYALARDRL